MTKTEHARRVRLAETLQDLGFTAAEVETLRRISNTLRNWHELECGTGEGQTTRHVEREGPDGDGDVKPVLVVQYPLRGKYVRDRFAIPDRETSARNRLLRTLNARNERSAGRVDAYVQTDPRGAALYILRPGDVPAGGDVMSYYTRGICVY